MNSRGRLLAKILMVLLASATAGSLGCGGDSQAAPEPLVEVQSTAAKIATISQVVTAEGVLYPVRQASLAPKISAPVIRFYVNRGDKVHQGQLLAVLDHRDLQAAVVSAQGSYEQAKATYALNSSATLPEALQKAQLDVRDAQVSLAAQQKAFDSEEELFKQGAIPRRQLDQTRVALTTAQSLYDTAKQHLANLEATGAKEEARAAQGQLESTRGQYMAATAQLEYSELRSPINGSIADRSVYPGDIATAGVPLLTVMDTSSVVVRLHIPQPQAVLLKLGNQATLTAPGLDQPLPGKVTVLSPALDPNSTTVEVWVEASNPERKLQPGTTVAASILARKVAGALVIPIPALLNGPGGEQDVMVVKSDGRAHLQKVETGIREGSLVQILQGLKAGDQVIVTGAFGLPDNTKVKAQPWGAKPDASEPGV
ncbi:MAG TPA: efflux RND transporter periplasmic adaptor subunit [Acidobacteriaceae bacterium]